MFDTSVFANIKSKADYDAQRQAMKQKRGQMEMQETMNKLKIAQAQKDLMSGGEMDLPMVLGKAQQVGFENLSPQEQQFIIGSDIEGQAKVTTDARGNLITNQSLRDLLGQSPQQARQMPTSVLQGQRADSGMVSPTTQRMTPDNLPFDDIASQPDLPMNGLPQNMVDPMQMLPRPDTTGLSPYAAEDLISEWKLKNMELQGKQQQARQDKQKEMPKAELAFNQMRDDTENMITTVDKAIDQTGGWSAGWGGKLSGIPASDAKNLESTLSTIRADAAFSTLQQMRDASKTGGALGAISEKELGLLQNAKTALDQSQDPKQLKDNLENYKRIRSQALKNTAEAFKIDYGYYPKGLEEFVQGQAQPKEQGQVSWEEYFK